MIFNLVNVIANDNITPASLTVSGDWTNDQFINTPVDITGLTFTVTYRDGSTASTSAVSFSPSTWSSTVGLQTVTFSYTENNVTVTATKSADVQKYADPVLNNNTWAKIQTVAASGLADQYWDVGDYKEVSVAAGTVDQMSVSAGTYRAVIIGIDHNPTYENPNSIDFCIGQDTSGTDICFYNPKNQIGVRMNATMITTGGWTGSQMYLTYLPQFYSLLSGNTGLQSAMIAPKKYTNNVEGGSAHNNAAAVTLSENINYKLFLMAEFEIFGVNDRANMYERYKQSQYEYYSSSGLAKSKVRYIMPLHLSRNWWSRSPRCDNVGTGSFCMVNSVGGTSTNGADYTDVAFTPCFRVGATGE